MTSTTEPCGCVCPNLIGPRDPHPWFKGPGCQALWQASLEQPEEIRAAWRTEQRFFCEMLSTAPWGRYNEWSYPYTRAYMVSAANSVMQDASSELRVFNPNDDRVEDVLEDALLILTYRRNVWLNNGHYTGPRDLVPPWVWEQRSRRRVTDMWQWTMEQVGLRVTQQPS